MGGIPTHAFHHPAGIQKGGPKIALRGGDGMGARRRGGGGFQKWASVPGPLFCAGTVVATKGAGTQILARKIFFHSKISPHICVVKDDQRDVGIILSRVCWGRTPPPPGTAGRAAPAQTPLPARRPRRGRGGLGKWASVPSPPPQSNFLPAKTSVQNIRAPVLLPVSCNTPAVTLWCSPVRPVV